MKIIKNFIPLITAFIGLTFIAIGVYLKNNSSQIPIGLLFISLSLGILLTNKKSLNKNYEK